MEIGKLYALGAGLVWGFTPFFSKLAMAGASVRFVMALSATSGFLLLVVLGLLQGQQGWFSAPLPTVGVYVATGITGSLLGRTFFFKGIEKIGGARANSILNSGPLLTTILAIVVLGERLTLPIGAGVVLIVSGIYFISAQHSEPGMQSFRRIDILWPFASAFFYSFSTILKRLSAVMTPAPFLGVFYSHGAATMIFLISFLAGRSWREIQTVKPRHVFHSVVAGFTISSGAYMTFLAVQDQPALIVSPIWRVSPLVSLIASYLLLRRTEVVTLKDFLGTLAIVAGVLVLLRMNS